MHPVTVRALAILTPLLLCAPPPSDAARGGPDGGNWSWSDSREPGVDTSVESTTSSTTITTTWQDDEILSFDLSFPFTLYGTTSRTVWLSSNGWLSLADPTLAGPSPLNLSIPDRARPNAMVAFYWDDLTGTAASFARHGPTANGHALLLRLAQKSGGIIQVTIQFYRNGSLKVLYSAVGSGASATIGIEDGGGNNGTELLRNGTASGGFALATNYAVLFHPAAAPACASAAALGCPGSIAGTTAGGSDVASYGCSTNTYTGSEAIYEMTLTTPQSIDLTLSGLGVRRLDLFLLRAGCDGYVDCVTGGGDVLNAPLVPPGTYYIVVDGRTPADDGAFSVNTTCAAATTQAIGCGAINVRASNLGPDLFTTYGCGTRSYAMGEAIYQFTNPSRSVVTLTRTDPASYDAFFFIPSPTLAGDCIPGLGSTAVTIGNVAAGDYFISLDSATAAGTTGLSIMCTDMAATDVACGARLSGTTTTRRLLDRYSCWSDVLDGGEAFYVLDNPAGDSFAVGLSGVPTSADLDVVVLDAALPAPTSSVDCLGAGGSTARVDGPPPGSYLIAVDARNQAVGVPFDLEIVCGDSTLDCASAVDLPCGSFVAGDTATGRSDAAVYGSDHALYTGPEQVYRLVNPTEQPVGIVLAGADPSLDIVLLRSCDPDDVIRVGDSSIIDFNLPADTYYLVVDGRDGVASPYELGAFCGGDPGLEPAVLDVEIAPGSCYTETKRLTLPVVTPAADIMFSLDMSGSMGAEHNQVRDHIRDIFNELSLVLPSLTFGVASFGGPGGSWTDPICGGGFGGGGGVAFSLDQALTTDISLVEAALVNPGGSGGAERYNYSFFQAYDNPTIGWRDCSRRLWLSFGDEPPWDCDLGLCQGIPGLNTGLDPGPDFIIGNGNDLPLVPTVDNMAANGIILMPVDSSQDPTLQSLWDCLARRTGGQAFFLDGQGRVPAGLDLVDELVRVISEAVGGCPELRLIATGPNAAWAAVDPVVITDIESPYLGAFEIDFCVPVDTTPGSYDITIEARCLGAGACASELLATQEVHITVPCAAAAEPRVAAYSAICEGASLTLDATPTTGCSAGYLYRWLEGAAVLCDWSGSPTCDLTPASTATSITLEVACANATECWQSFELVVETVPHPGPHLAQAPPICVGDEVTLDASGSDPDACPVPLEYRFWTGPTMLRDWDEGPTHGPLAPVASGTYTVEVRCTADPGCQATTTTDVTVVPPPTASAGADVDVCAMEAVLLDGSASTDACPGGGRYEWREGATVVRPAATDPTWMPPTDTPGTHTYTLVVICDGLATCSHGDDVVVRARSCALAVDFERVDATVSDDLTGVDVAWRTSLEDGTTVFAIERAPTENGPFASVSPPIPAQGAGFDYLYHDPETAPTPRPWYRVVEYTVDGRGDVSPPVQVSADDRERPGERSRRRGRARTRGR